MLAFHSAKTLFSGVIANIKTKPIKSHFIDTLLNPNDLRGSFLTKIAYNIGGSVKVKI
jgi:hypothetical protein